MKRILLSVLVVSLSACGSCGPDDVRLVPVPEEEGGGYVAPDLPEPAPETPVGVVGTEDAGTVETDADAGMTDEEYCERYEGPHGRNCAHGECRRTCPH